MVTGRGESRWLREAGWWWWWYLWWVGVCVVGGGVVLCTRCGQSGYLVFCFDVGGGREADRVGMQCIIYLADCSGSAVARFLKRNVNGGTRLVIRGLEQTPGNQTNYFSRNLGFFFFI